MKINILLLLALFSINLLNAQWISNNDNADEFYEVETHWVGDIIDSCKLDINANVNNLKFINLTQEDSILFEGVIDSISSMFESKIGLTYLIRTKIRGASGEYAAYFYNQKRGKGINLFCICHFRFERELKLPQLVSVNFASLDKDELLEVEHLMNKRPPPPPPPPIPEDGN